MIFFSVVNPLLNFQRELRGLIFFSVLEMFLDNPGEIFKGFLKIEENKSILKLLEV